MKAGITLFECILILAVIALSVVIAIPWITHNRQQAQVIEYMSRGRQIHSALYGIHDFVPFNESLFQSRIINNTTNSFSSSTEIFRQMRITGYLNMGYDFFAGPGLSPCTSTNSADFTSANNAWCLVTDGNRILNASTPVIFTKNVLLDYIGSDAIPSLSTNMPFGNLLWVFVTRAGSAASMDGASIHNWNTGNEVFKVLKP